MTTQTSWYEWNFHKNVVLVKQMQPIAIQKFYSVLWPGAEVTELDLQTKDELARILDIGGSDKLLRFKNGTISFLAQRIREYTYATQTDWTIRETEATKVLDALQASAFIPSFYAYGYANKARTDFVKFKIFDYRQTLMDLGLRVVNSVNRPGLVSRYGFYRLIPNKDKGPGFYPVPFDHIRNFILEYPEQGKLF